MTTFHPSRAGVSHGSGFRGLSNLFRSQKRLHFVALIVLAGCALFTRFLAIASKSLFLDEAVSWRFANVPLRGMFNLTAHDEHPPLYYGALHYWVQIFGTSEVALRAPSALFGAVTIVLVGAVAWKTGRWLLTIAASGFLLLNGSYLACTQEARMYPLESLLAICSAIALANFVTKPTIMRFWLFAFICSMLTYTHYSGFIVVGVEGIILVCYGLEQMILHRKLWLLSSVALLAAILFLAYIPWWSTFRTHARVGVGHIPEPTLVLVRNDGRTLLGMNEARGGWLALALPLLALGSYGLVRAWRQPFVVALGGVAFVPIAQILVSVWFKPVFDVRYAAPFIPGLMFLCALGLSEGMALSGKARPVAPLAHATVLALGCTAAIVMGIGLAQTYRAPPLQDWRAVAKELHGSPVFIAPGYQALPIEYYRGSSFGISPLSDNATGRMAQGYMPIPRQKMDQSTLLFLQGERGRTLLPLIETYFHAQVMHQYLGWIGGTSTLYELTPLTIAQYNVNIFGPYTTGQWSVTREGYLETTSPIRSYFALRSPTDKDGVGGVDEDYVIHVEYLDRGPPSLSLAGITAREHASLQLADVTIGMTGAWKSLDVPVKRGSLLSDVFSLNTGVTIRTLEMRRYELAELSLGLSPADPSSQWFLRSDGYLETTSANACGVVPADTSTETKALKVSFTWLYSGNWVSTDVNFTYGAPSCVPAWPFDFIVRRISLSPAD